MDFLTDNFGALKIIGVFTLSFWISASLVALGRANKLTVPDSSRSANVQNIHVVKAPRIGGVSIFAAFACALVLVPYVEEVWYGGFLFAASFIFIAGLAEDIGLNISPKNRLAASLVSSLACVFLLDASLPRVEFAIIDRYIEIWWIGVPVTVIMTAGFAHAFNMIDGLHGLCLGNAAITALSLMIIADQSGSEAVKYLSLTLLIAIFGLLVFNFPWGLIFLGDAGAYTIGFVLSWFGIILLVGSENTSFWAIILTMLLPSCDMVLSIFRRAFAKRIASKADRMHFHHVVFRNLRVVLMQSKFRKYANPISTLCLIPFAALPALFGVYFWDNVEASKFAIGVFAALYCVTYFGLIKLLKSRKLRVIKFARH